MRQGVANGKSERTQPECVEEGAHLVADANGAVLQIAVIKAQPGIDQDSGHAIASGGLDFTGEVVLHQTNGIFPESEIADLTNVGTLDEAEDYGRVMRGNHSIDLG